MADVKISELPVASTVTDADIVVINQGGTTKTAARSLVKGGSSGTVTSVTAGTGLSGGTITGSGTIALSTPVSVANGGTGVAVSSGASSVVLRDSNQNISVNSVVEGFSSIAASGTQVVLTVASEPSYLVTGSGGQTIKLPDATTLQNGVVYLFNNNQSSGAISVNNNSNTLVVSIPSGGFVIVTLLSNATAAGSWERHEQAPSNVSWSTNTLDYAGSIINATWNGTAVAINRGGTGATTQQTAINALIGTQAAGKFLRSDGTNATLDSIQASDVPALNQNTTGTAANVTGTVAVANGGTGGTTADQAADNLGFPAQIRPVASNVNLGTGTTASYVYTATATTPSYVAHSILTIGDNILCSGATVTANLGPWVVTTTGYQAVFVGTLAASSTSLNIVSVTSGTVAVGQAIVIPNSTNTITIASFGTFTVLAGTGTVNLSGSITTAQTTVTMASGTGIAPVYTRPAWFRGTLLTSAYYFQTQRSSNPAAGQGNVYSIYPSSSSESLPSVTANNSGGTAWSNSLVSQRSPNAILGSNTFTASSTQNFAAGTLTTAPIKFQNGVTQTTPVAHSVEWDGTSMYATNAAASRKALAYTDSNITGTAAGLSATLAVASGGTGATTLTGLVKGTGTTAMVAATAGTDYVVPSGNITGTAGGLSATLAVASGGTGQNAYTNGQLLIGNTTGSTLAKATLTPGAGIAITNGSGAITVALAATVSTAAPSGGVDGDLWYQY